MRIVVALVAVLAGALPAPAQDQSPNDAQRRRAHLPYVRTATSCLARSIEASNMAFASAANGQWLEAVTAVFPVCKPQLVAMVTAHDQLYGVGTGVAFYSGPYKDDLPRALSARLQPEIDRRVAMAAQAERARFAEEQRLAAAEAERVRAAKVEAQRISDEKLTVFKTVVQEHEKCFEETLAKLLPYSNEPAETLSLAVVTLCNDFEKKRISMGIALFEVTKAYAEKLTAEATAKSRAELVTAIVTMRAAAAAKAAQGGSSPSNPSFDGSVRPARSL